MKRILNAVLYCCITFCLCVPILAYDSIPDQALEKTQDEIGSVDGSTQNIWPCDNDENVDMVPDGDGMADNTEYSETTDQPDFFIVSSSESPEYFQSASSKSGSYSAEYGADRIKTVGFDLIIQFNWRLVANKNGDFVFEEPGISGFKTTMVKNSSASLVYRDISILENDSKCVVSGDKLSLTVNVDYTMTFTERRTGKTKTVNYVDSFNVKSSDLF